MAQANSTFYNIVVPKLYETIIITESNISFFYNVRGSDDNTSSPTTTETPDPLENGWPSHDQSGNGEESYDYLEARKDWALGHCLRLIIDVPLQNAVDLLIDIAERLPHRRLGSVQETIFTRRSLASDFEDLIPTVRSHAKEARNHESYALSTMTPETKRVVMHLPAPDSTSVFGFMLALYGWCRTFDGDNRNTTQFVIYGVTCDVPSHLYRPMGAELHFGPNPVPQAQAHELPSIFLAWLTRGLDFYRKTDPPTRLYDVAPFVLRNDQCPTDPAKANESAWTVMVTFLRDRLELELPPRFSEAERKAYLALFTEGTVLCHGEYEEEEYPVRAPKPIIIYEPIVTPAPTEVAKDVLDEA